MTRLYIIIFFVFSIALSGCKPNRGDHHRGIGRVYTFSSFELSSSTGHKVPFSIAELRAIEKVWFKSTIPVADKNAIINSLMAGSRGYNYSYVLNDGYSESGVAYIASISGSLYLYVTLEGDAGGFMADSYGDIISLDSVISTQRIADLQSGLRIPELKRTP